MAVHDYIIDNQTTPSFRSDLNNALAAIVTNNSSASAPSTTYAGMWWLDTTNSYLKIRDQNNSNWIIVAEFDVANSRAEFLTNKISAASAAGIDIFNSSGTKIIDLQVASEATAKAGTNNTELMTPLRTRQAAGIVPGVLMPFAGASQPSGWLLCFGQSVSTTTYADLFNTIGYTYGGSGGSFNIPDLRGRTVAGQDDMGGSSANRLTSPINGDTLGAAGGAEGHQLTEAELAAHDHLLAKKGGGSNVNNLTVAQGALATMATSFQSGDESMRMPFAAGNPAPDVLKSGTAGSGNSHNNVQPTIILNYIIKT
jgi:microcystin-dependent protein